MQVRSGIPPKFVDLEPKAAPKPDGAKTKMLGAVPTNWHKPIPTDFGPTSGASTTVQNF